MYVDRLPPHDISAEESVIGSLLIDGESVSSISAWLDHTDFYGEKNRWCFEAALDLFHRGEAINQITLSHELSVRDRLEEIGGSAYLSHLVMVVPTSVHIEYYARIVQRTSIMRQLITAGGRISELGLNESDAQVDAVLSKAEDALIRVRSNYQTSDFTHIRQGMDEYLERGAAMTTDGIQPRVSPVSTGFDGIDNLLGNGMQRSDMIVVAARPSMGKSALALNIARSAAGDGNRVGIFSLEMSREQVEARLLSAESGLDSYRLRTGLMSLAEENAVLDAVGALSDLPLYTDDTPVQTIAEMRSKARRMESEQGLDLLIIDYIQLIGGNRRSENRVQEMSEISRSIKGMARDLDVPVIACSQLNRAIELRPNHRPLLSDLRESGAIEQDSDVVAFIHREDAYVNEEDWQKRNPAEQYPRNIAEIIVAKHRNGPTGSVRLRFDEYTATFASMGS